ncbi:MAG: hypothetical protein JXB13_15350 [Phycisphaerae bacterium]|nr:hypothetical protein [Phycisphaerae bacterium]
MPITLLCPNLRCRAILQVPDACRGKRVRCGQCGITLSVPATGTPGGRTDKSVVIDEAGAGGKGKGKKK